jgi:hypothetical protein
MDDDYYSLIAFSNATNDPHSQCISQRQHITNIPNTHPNGIKTTHIFSMHIQHKWFVKLTDRRFHLRNVGHMLPFEPETSKVRYIMWYWYYTVWSQYFLIHLSYIYTSITKIWKYKKKLLWNLMLCFDMKTMSITVYYTAWAQGYWNAMHCPSLTLFNNRYIIQ